VFSLQHQNTAICLEGRMVQKHVEMVYQIQSLVVQVLPNARNIPPANKTEVDDYHLLGDDAVWLL
jgi:hypothetical protein